MDSSNIITVFNNNDIMSIINYKVSENIEIIELLNLVLVTKKLIFNKNQYLMISKIVANYIHFIKKLKQDDIKNREFFKKNALMEERPVYTSKYFSNWIKKPITKTIKKKKIFKELYNYLQRIKRQYYSTNIPIFRYIYNKVEFNLYQNKEIKNILPIKYIKNLFLKNEFDERELIKFLYYYHGMPIRYQLSLLNKYKSILDK